MSSMTLLSTKSVFLLKERGIEKRIVDGNWGSLCEQRNLSSFTVC